MSEKEVVEQVAKLLGDNSRETEQRIKKELRKLSKEKLTGDDLYYTLANRITAKK